MMESLRSERYCPAPSPSIFGPSLARSARNICNSSSATSKTSFRCWFDLVNKIADLSNFEKYGGIHGKQLSMDRSRDFNGKRARSNGFGNTKDYIATLCRPHFPY